jgi:hypothetical protein
MRGPNDGTVRSPRHVVDIHDRLVPALMARESSDRTPFSRMFCSVIGSIGSSKRFVAIQANPYKIH